MIRCCAVVIVLFTPWVFTNNADVIALAGKLAPLISIALIAHTASLATEGMLLAGVALLLELTFSAALLPPECMVEYNMHTAKKSRKASDD